MFPSRLNRQNTVWGLYAGSRKGPRPSRSIDLESLKNEFLNLRKIPFPVRAGMNFHQGQVL